MASHLAMLYAIAGEDMIRSSYEEAVASGYLWHEFGDTNLILTRTYGRRLQSDSNMTALDLSGLTSEMYLHNESSLTELVAA